MQRRYRPSISGHTLPGQHRPCSMVSKIRTASGDGDVDGPTEEEGFDGEALHDLLFDTYGPYAHLELAMPFRKFPSRSSISGMVAIMQELLHPSC